MVILYWFLSVVVISVVLGEIHYRYSLKSREDNRIVIEKDWRKSINRDFLDFNAHDTSIKEAMDFEFSQML